ncbi:hypothetical protein IU485_27625 [Nocardia cyriacigeorgica]|uniref:hypothetical protein n=1 Tax=Nocardia cyriacigeorgica TaxID=135487 RepID=UPI001893F4D1|nr:hypothetical protein [Nocardia cyriacigeorgica]MBF6085147.1 hypothetical protein [Nocardia cyriacigeorgica]
MLTYLMIGVLFALPFAAMVSVASAHGHLTGHKLQISWALAALTIVAWPLVLVLGTLTQMKRAKSAPLW